MPTKCLRGNLCSDPGTSEQVLSETSLPYEVAVSNEQIDQAVSVLRRGGLVGFPTETVYGLGACAFDGGAVASVYAAKGRPSRNPLIVHVSGESMAKEVAAEWPDRASRLASAFWPGPVSIVVRRSERVPDVVTAGGSTVCVRMPAHADALRLIEALGEPLVGPSANRSGGVSPTRAEHVRAEFPGLLVIDGGACRIGIESTVVDVTDTQARVLRRGVIGREAMESVLGEAVDDSGHVEHGMSLKSPGLLTRHYAPQTRTLVLGSLDEVRDAARGFESCAVLVQESIAWPSSVQAYVMPREALAYAAMLYATLRGADESGVEAIIVQRPTGTGDVSSWAAIGDRLSRACASENGDA